MNATTLSHGEFFGNVDRRRELNGFILADATPAVPDHQVPRHTHEEAHFVLILDGAYVTSARNGRDTGLSPALIFNPAGTTHRDRFRSKTGRFFTLSVGRAQLEIATDHYRLVPCAWRLTHPHAVDAARRLAAECARGRAGAPMVAEGLCWELLAHAQPQGDRTRTAPGWLRAAREMLRDRATERLNLGDLAGALGIHPIHLTRTFRRFYRCIQATTCDAAGWSMPPPSCGTRRGRSRTSLCQAALPTRAISRNPSRTPMRCPPGPIENVSVGRLPTPDSQSAAASVSRSPRCPSTGLVPWIV